MRVLYFLTARGLRLVCSSFLYFLNLGCRTDVLNTEGRSPKIARGVQEQNNGLRSQGIVHIGELWEGPEEDEDDWDRGLSEYMFDRLSRRSIAARAELITIIVLPETRK